MKQPSSATFIRAGRAVINLELVTLVVKQENYLSVFFVGEKEPINVPDSDDVFWKWWSDRVSNVLEVPANGNP
jgi:hypothetical protein